MPEPEVRTWVWATAATVVTNGVVAVVSVSARNELSGRAAALRYLESAVMVFDAIVMKRYKYMYCSYCSKLVLE